MTAIEPLGQPPGIKAGPTGAIDNAVWTPASTIAHIPDALPPPRVRDMDSLERWPMSLDDAVHIALQANPMIRDAGGRVLQMPDTVQSTFDPAILANDPVAGTAAALSAFDARFETGLFWNGGGRSVNSAFSSGAFGVFSQPTTLAKVGFGKTFTSGTQLRLGGVGGYDSALASGLYAAYGADVRHPLMRGAGTSVNQITGPNGTPGAYRGVWIAQIHEEKSQLELRKAVRDLVRDVSRTYWELHFAYENLSTKRSTLEQARQTWEREKLRLAENVTSSDAEALARQQYFTTDAGVQNAIGGFGAGSGVYDKEIQLRTLLGLPMSDGRLILPVTKPLHAEFRFDWNEAMLLAHGRRVELQIQNTKLRRGELELKAAHNLARPQVDLVGQYRRLADDPDDGNALFTEALQGWQIGVEVLRPVGSRRENAAVRSAELRLRREQALLIEQQRQIAAELRRAFTELDRAYGVMQSLAASRDAASIRWRAESRRHAEGQTFIERVVEAQSRAMHAETAYRRSLVDYNLAFVYLHLARGTLLDTFGIGFSDDTSLEEMQFAKRAASVFDTSDQTTVAARNPHQR